jgi:hypothetical protein
MGLGIRLCKSGRGLLGCDAVQSVLQDTNVSGVHAASVFTSLHGVTTQKTSDFANVYNCTFRYASHLLRIKQVAE